MVGGKVGGGAMGVIGVLLQPLVLAKNVAPLSTENPALSIT